MPSPLGFVVPGTNISPYHLHGYLPDTVLDEISRQVAASQVARRSSRGSNGQRAGGAMRIVKPNSASNSPGSSISMGRRRTLINDGNLAWRRQHIMDQVALPLPGMDFTDPSKRLGRPVSWHPASTSQQPIQSQQHPLNPRFNDPELYANFQQMSPIAAPYSCNTSPSTFSPLSLPYNDFNTQPFLPIDSWQLAPQPTPSYVSPASESSLTYPEHFPSLSTAPSESTQSSSSTEWNTFVMHGFDNTSPPTPENLPQVQQPRTTVPSDDAISFQPLEEPEEEGEVLVGMGLYDPPDKYDQDPHLNNYRSTVTSLLGSTFRTPEPTGKGLKLEETWEPPESDDENEDDEEEDDEDEKASDDDEANEAS